ncbi:MAG: hypothetical protein DWQ06_06150 [Calditrichaeota bacterium]|nr:MAG: hypothetical protein DWQ06_06150 [Calditrichota bacterium]
MKTLNLHKNYFGFAIFIGLIPFTFQFGKNGFEFLILENNFEYLFVFLAVSFISSFIGLYKMKNTEKVISNT